MLYQIDVDYGLENERICQSKIENFFNEKLKKIDVYDVHNNFLPLFLDCLIIKFNCFALSYEYCVII